MARHAGENSDAYANIVNLVIDSCFERLGAALYRGSGEKLAQALHLFKDVDLFAAAEDHLAAFTLQEADRDKLITLELLELIDQQIGNSSSLAYRMQYLAVNHHRWVGRVASYWITAIVSLLIALRALLQGGGGMYVREKFQVATRHIDYGVEEAAQVGLSLNHGTD